MTTTSSVRKSVIPVAAVTMLALFILLSTSFFVAWAAPILSISEGASIAKRYDLTIGSFDPIPPGTDHWKLHN
ncbi:hypothetical protein BGZ47_000728 [Haplosporangium gracile]|nr:hypothetical protein BGZ47_000728 [Haplosporangium gracile]